MNQRTFIIAIVAGMVIGSLIGVLAPAVGVSIYWLGELFLKALKMLVIPLIVSSMVVGVASRKCEQLFRVCCRERSLIAMRVGEICQMMARLYSYCPPSNVPRRLVKPKSKACVLETPCRVMTARIFASSKR